MSDALCTHHSDQLRDQLAAARQRETVAIARAAIDEAMKEHAK